MASSPGLPTPAWNPGCESMREFMGNDDLLSLLESYIHDRHHLHSLCLVNRMFNVVFSQSLYEHLLIKHTHVHCIEPDSENFQALLNSPSLRHTRKLSLLQMDQLYYTRTEAASRYGPILNEAICQIVKRCPDLRQFTFSAPSRASCEGLPEYFVSEETLDCLHSSCPMLQSLSLEQAFPRIPRRGGIGQRVEDVVGVMRFPEFSNLITLHMMGIRWSALWAEWIAGILSSTPQVEELSLSMRSPICCSITWDLEVYSNWSDFLISLSDEYEALGKPPLKLRKLKLHNDIGFVVHTQPSIGYLESLTDLEVLEELRIFNNHRYPDESMVAPPHLRRLSMPYRFITYDTMPRLRKFSFDNMDGDIMDWLIQVAETPFKDQLTLCNDGVDYWEAGAELFDAVSSARARKRAETPLDSFTASDLASVLRPIHWIHADSLLVPDVLSECFVFPGRLGVGYSNHLSLTNPHRPGECTWVKSMRLFVGSADLNMPELLLLLDGMDTIENLMIVSYMADHWENFVHPCDNQTWEANARRIAITLPSLKYLKVNRVSWRFQRSHDDNGLMAQRLSVAEDEMLGRFPPLSDLPIYAKVWRGWRRSVMSPGLI
ncbi:hypothetical protein CGCS363_v003684 [Colletotrichum siamense]|uniref:uncharacterized protein n=1 Tax=Colletotrichum siamense TaxID=690259 RepID=UPI001872226B|nr:uncharacterized protein CGCS363_v003684 [Colletotrichum siamense]KAF5510532.1 hypothetical protein CGCS363_v003684 [Colletotrichum siamense]